ncbi:MAG: NHLP family bacteriocin export ABC transporter peptidase/permease/ATPase subunit [Legionella sp.]|jgi:NHLM bacteriocin system ABC transporter peptidase/ATP-binding protein
MSSAIRTKTPVILQMEALECGAAALAIILAYYKRYVSLEELRHQCGVSRDGSKAINMLKAARSYGLKAQGAQTDMDGLSELTYPFIAFWEFNHFIVVEGYNDRFIYINDPATGLRAITYDEFSRGFTGVVLLFEPTEEFKPGGEKDSLWSGLKPKLAGIKKAFLFILIASLSLTLPDLFLAGFSKIFIDDILINHVSGWLIPLLWGMLLTAIMRGLLSWIKESHLLRLELKVIMSTSAQFFWHIMRLPMSFFNQRFTGDVCSRLSANNRITSLISSELSESIVGIINMAIYAIFMLLFDWVLTFIGIFIAALNGMVFLFISNHIANNTKTLLQEQGKLTGMEMLGIEGIETLKASGVEDDYFQRWAGYHAKTINSQQKIQLYSSIISIILPLLTGVSAALILGVGGIRIINGHLTIGGLVAFQTLLMSFSAPLTTLLGLGTQLQTIRGDLSRLNDVLRNKIDPQLERQELEPNNALLKDEKLAGTITLNSVSFGYSPLEAPLFADISLKLDAGKSLAIVGSSGCGKSTLAKIICGLYTPWTGSVLLDNRAYKDIPREIISNSLAFVDQDIFLFEGSIRTNLTLWDSSISRENLQKAISDADLNELLTSRAHGLGSTIMNEGVNFSGGQRQQMEIARSLTKNPNLLILDEATAALDAITESKIIKNIKRRGCSLIMVAHRLSTIRQCDEIIVLEQGAIVQQGSHEYLSQVDGVYKRLLLELSNDERQ